MTSSTSATCEAAPRCVDIHAVGPDGFDQRRSLSSEDAVVVGTSPACGIRIAGAGIAAMHCTISYEQEQLVVEDWDTVGGTYIDGTRIARRVVVQPGATLTIAEYQISTSAVAPDDDEPDDDEPVEAAVEAFDDEPTRESEVVKVLAEQPEVAAQRERELPRPTVPEVVDADDDDVWDTPADTAADFVDRSRSELAYADTGCVGDDDTLELLKIEVEFLRTELAERDARVAELEQTVGQPTSSDDDMPDREEVEALVSRLEDLLAELDHSDERLKTMAEVLKASEDANVAAEEERTQMESWIGEVERRVRVWESEWHAERDSLTKRITELTAERDAAEAQGSSRETVQLIQELRADIVRKEQQAAQLQKQRDEALKRIESAEVESLEDRVAAAVEVAMREERLLISQAKAECARERAKLVQLQDELASQQTSSGSEPNIADVRIRAFREHLKEIRATEPNSRPAPPTMSQRMAKLWRKIEGRPLDTD